MAFQTRHEVVWQQTKAHFAGRTFEEAFAYENIQWCQDPKQKDLRLRVITKKKSLELNELTTKIHERVKSRHFKKTEFALALMTKRARRLEGSAVYLRWSSVAQRAVNRYKCGGRRRDESHGGDDEMTRRIDKPDTEADTELRQYLDAKDRGCFVMVAGAGSGKTTSLVKALDHIGKTCGAEMRRRGQQIACITYTDRAVGEILTDIANSRLIHVSTIHSFLWKLVKPFQRDIGKWLRLRIEGKLEELVQERESYGPRVQEKTRKKNARAFARMKSHLENFEKVKLL